MTATKKKTKKRVVLGGGHGLIGNIGPKHKAAKKKTKKKPEPKSPNHDGAEALLAYVLDHVAEAGVIEGRKPNKRVVFRGMLMSPGQLHSIRDTMVETIAANLDAWGASAPTKKKRRASKKKIVRKK